MMAVRSTTLTPSSGSGMAIPAASRMLQFYRVSMDAAGARRGACYIFSQKSRVGGDVDEIAALRRRAAGRVFRRRHCARAELSGAADTAGGAVAARRVE